MRTIKLWDGIRVTTASESEVFESPSELFEAINIYDKEAQAEITKQLFCFGIVDLSEAYQQPVVLTVYRKEEQ